MSFTDFDNKERCIGTDLHLIYALFIAYDKVKVKFKVCAHVYACVC